jgi:hypothetical protein
MPEHIVEPDAADLDELQREARAAERADVDAYWAAVAAGELHVEPTSCAHPLYVAGRCIACALTREQVQS